MFSPRAVAVAIIAGARSTSPGLPVPQSTAAVVGRRYHVDLARPPQLRRSLQRSTCVDRWCGGGGRRQGERRGLEEEEDYEEDNRLLSPHWTRHRAKIAEPSPGPTDPPGPSAP